MKLKNLILEVTWSWNKRDGNQLFWDFYAMYYLWSTVGGGVDVLSGKNPYPIHGKVPSFKSQEVIDKLFAKVLTTTSKALIFYLKRASILELRHILSYHSGLYYELFWLDKAIQEGKINYQEDFDEFVKSKYGGSVTSDLFLKIIHFNELYEHNPNFFIYDKIKSLPSKEGEGGDLYDIENEPTKTGIPHKKKIPDYEGNEDNEFVRSPDNPEYFQLKEVGHSEDVGNEKIESQYGLRKIKRIHTAMKKSGISISDLRKIYVKSLWRDDDYGGESWGMAVKRMLNLEKLISSEQMSNELMKKIAFEIDQIYDLQHNTGHILNKGYVQVEKVDLDVRSKVSNIALMIPHVSSNIEFLIKRYLPYMGVDSRYQNVIDDIQNENFEKFSDEDIKILNSFGINDQISGLMFSGEFIGRVTLNFLKSKNSLYIAKTYPLTYLEFSNDLTELLSTVESMFGEAENEHGQFKKLPMDNIPSKTEKPAGNVTTSNTIKVDSIFEKRILDAGFVWDMKTKTYSNKKLNHVLEIYKDRSSKIYPAYKPSIFVNFPDLGKLLLFLKNEYNSQFNL